MSFNIDNLVRENIKKVKPYSSARDEFTGKADIYLDANENCLGSPILTWYHRYPDPHQRELKEKISAIKGRPAEDIFIGNGSDECIDLIFRCFCEPGVDNCIICPPTYGMYEVSAAINNIEVRKAPLRPNFQLNLETLFDQINQNTKLIWLCSPNNPTGNNLKFEDIELVLNNFGGLVIVDEAYINFSKQRTTTIILEEYPNLIVMQTLSKAWGLAGLRLGMAFASQDIVQYLNRIKPPYNINQASQELALQALDNIDAVNSAIKEIVLMRDELEKVLVQMPGVLKVYPSDANFLLVKVMQPKELYQFLLDKSIVIRDRSNVQLCEGCIRITVGTDYENTRLVDAFYEFIEKNKAK